VRTGRSVLALELALFVALLLLCGAFAASLAGLRRWATLTRTLAGLTALALIFVFLCGLRLCALLAPLFSGRGLSLLFVRSLASLSTALLVLPSRSWGLLSPLPLSLPRSHGLLFGLVATLLAALLLGQRWSRMPRLLSCLLGGHLGLWIGTVLAFVLWLEPPRLGFARNLLGLPALLLTERLGVLSIGRSLVGATTLLPRPARLITGWFLLGADGALPLAWLLADPSPSTGTLGHLPP
jgi:hypothetical protein